jgi:CRP-like cAMP-binding protein
MQPMPLPRYVTEAADWFSNEVADPRIGIRAAARRPFREIKEVAGPLLVRSGLIAITTIDASGARQTVALRYPNELILPFKAAGCVMLEAVLDSDLDAAEWPAFDAALSAKPEMHSVLRPIMSREKAIAYAWLAQFGLRRSLGRLAHLLCETFVRMSVDSTQPLGLPFNQQQLGEITGQTSVHVNRMLAQLEQRNLMSRNGRSIMVNDWSGLTDLAGFDPGYLT